MKTKLFSGCLAALCLGAGVLHAQEANEVERLRDEIRRLQENFDQVRQRQQQQIDALSKKLEDLIGTPVAAPATDEKKTADRRNLEQQLAAELAASPLPGEAGARPAAVPAPGRVASSGSTARAGSAYMNISFGTLLDMGWSTAADPSARLQLGDHDPQKRGFTLPNAEIALNGAVDPYFEGFANIVLKLDPNNETSIELEETYLQSTSLPANLQLKAGQFYANFGRQNPQHPHTWAFVDSPIILNRVFGPDGLRNPGAQLSWLAPTPFYTEVFLGVLDGQGGTTFSFRNAGEPDPSGVNRFAGRATLGRRLRGAQDLVFTPRIASSFDVSDTQTLVAGLSGAFGPNDTGPNARTEIYGADAYWKWKPVNAKAGFPFVSWQTEAVLRHFAAGADPLANPPLPPEGLRDWGVYTQVVWGFTPRWVTGLRWEYATGNAGAFDPDDPYRGERWRFSPVLTFYPSEFSKVRFQYNYDRGEYFPSASSFWMQLEFALGAHAAHKF